MRAIIWGFLASLLASPAFAEETYPTKFVEGWEIYGWDDDCWMKTKFENGTELLYSFDAADRSSYISVRNPDWKSIVEGQRYSIDIRIDDWSMSENAGGRTGGNISPGINFFVEEEEDKLFIARLSLGKNIGFSVNSKNMGLYSLKGSRAAVNELSRCVGKLRARVVKDPFAG